jgi:Ca2+-binding EF-hand superfamily protein
MSNEAYEIKNIQENMQTASSAQLEKLFDFYDENKDGKINLAEMKSG